MSDVLQGCEALMLQSKVQFVLSHAHHKAQGALDAKPYRSARIGEDVLIAVSSVDDAGNARHRLGGDGASAAVPVLAYTQESGLGRILRAVIGRRLESLPVQIVLTAHLASVLRTMVLDGRGVAWLPRTLLEDDLTQGRLVTATSDDDWNVPLEIRLYRDEKLPGKAADAFWNTAVDKKDAS
jgi:DNA-binding transcriptional LysR family regulator